MNKCFAVFRVAIAVLSIGLAFAADKEGISVETRALCVKLSGEGNVADVRDKLDNKSYLLAGAPTPFMRLQEAGKTHDIALLVLKGNVLTASFRDTPFTASFRLDVRDEFFTIEVASVSDSDFEYLEFVRLPAAITETVGSQIDAAYNDKFAVAVMAATPSTHVPYPARLKDGVLLSARCWPEVDTRNVKAVGWNAAINLECHMGLLDDNGRTGETLDGMKTWQDLQHSGYFPDAIKEKLREKEMDFVLVKDSADKWRVHPVKYHRDHIVDPKVEATKTWKLDNDMPEGPISARIRAMTEIAPYGSEGNIVLFDPKAKEDITDTAVSSGVAVKAEISTEQTKSGPSSCKFTATRGEKARREWAKVEHRFDKPVDLLSHRAMGVWVYGDGKGELLNVQLEDAGHSLRDYYIDIDFTGWQYFTLDMPVTRRIWAYGWPYNPKLALRTINYKAIRSVNLYLADLKPGETASVFIGRIEALKETPTAPKNPTIAVGDRSITIPVEMKPDEYIEFDATGCRRFDPNGHVLGEPKPALKGAAGAPIMVPGENAISLSSDSDARARVTLMVKGKALE